MKHLAAATPEPELQEGARIAAQLLGCPAAAVVLRHRDGWRMVAGHGTAASLQAEWGALAEHGLQVAPAPGRAFGLLVALPIPGPEPGALLVADTATRQPEPEALDALEALARRLGAERGLAARLRALEAARERLDLDHRGALEAMADGVLTLGPEGRITSLNPAGAAILGLEPAEAIGGTLQELLLEEGGADAFIDAVLAPLSGEESGRQVVDFRRGEGAARRLSVSSTAYRLRLGPAAGRVGVTATFTDVTEMERLAQAEAALAARLAEQHGRLQDAYRELERTAAELRASGRRMQQLRLGATAGVTMLFLGLIGWALWPLLPSVAAPVPAAGGPASMVAEPRPVASRISVVGTLDAGAMVSVVAPFDGMVREKMFRYGGAVQRGEPLLSLDTGEVENRLREARAAEIRARQRVEELRGWTTGVEVARARRAVAAAELEEADLRARVGQALMLLRRGIIPAEEARNLQQQQRSQALQLQAARQDLEAALARGDAETLRIAELELAGAQARMRDLERDLANATLRAPVSGVVLLPPEAQGGRRPETLEVGSRLSRGQAALTIGDLESFQIRTAVDEIDISRVRPGLSARITGDGFEGLVLQGRVVAVAAQASAEGSAGRTGLPSFPVIVAVDGLAPEERARLAVGMSASISIIAYENPAAIVLPPGAVRLDGDNRVVRLRDPSGAVRSVPVTLGISTPDGVELRSGVSPGDVVLLGD